MKITILTPTYNRQSKLERLWVSLKDQTCKDFEWLVVDNGSTDDTKSLMNQLQTKSDFAVRYIYKTNGGKHTALNIGVKTIESELTFVVDSDDYVTENCISTILRVHQKYKNNVEICGYTFLRAFPDGRTNGKEFYSNEYIASYIEARINNDDTHADKAEVFKTQCLKEYPFPEYPGEHFLGEDLVWIRMARKYKMVHINQIIYIGDYVEDGLTKNRRSHNISSPVGCMHRAEEFMEPDIKWRYRVKGGLQYIIYGKFAGYSIKNLIREAPHKWIAIICIIPGLLLYQNWKMKFKR